MAVQRTRAEERRTWEMYWSTLSGWTNPTAPWRTTPTAVRAIALLEACPDLAQKLFVAAAALVGDSRSSLKARVMLRDAYSGRIDLEQIALAASSPAGTSTVQLC